MRMKCIEFEIDDSFEFFCPMTGTPVFGEDSFEPSKATVFVYSPEAGCVESCDDATAKVWEEVEEKEAESCDFDAWEQFKAKMSADNPYLVLFGFTSYGMACGPVSSTIYVCIDFAHRLEE